MSEWTDGRLKAFVVSALRSASRRYPPKYETLNEALVGKRLNESTKRLANHYTCAGCGQDFPSKQVQVDHRIPVVDPVDGFISWDVFIERLFCSKENLQVLCSTCHTEKSKLERNVRKKRN